jgi:hypothetical protein
MTWMIGKVIVVPRKTIFRQSALKAYKQNMEKDVLPRLISTPIIVCLWLLLVVLLAAGFFAWFAQVPTYVAGSGIILSGEDILQNDHGNIVGVVFLPANQSAQIQRGQPVDIQVGSTDMHVQSTIAQVEPGIMSPEAVRQHYQLGAVGADLVTQPSVVAIIKLDTVLPDTAYTGSLLTARIQTGSQRLFALLLGSGQFLGSSS